MTDFIERLRRDPDLYPHSYDPVNDAVLLTEMTREGFAAASFLDQRMLTPQTKAQWLSAKPLDPAMEPVERADCRFIFHIGHVGSTLLARMMGAVDGVLSLREPATLRTLAQLKPELETPESVIAPESFARKLTTFLKLWSRTYAPEQRSIVKATSFASELAGELTNRPGSQPAIAMTVAPEVYIASILGGEGSRQELKALAQGRLKRLHARIGGGAWRFWELSEGERAAMSWACEMTALGAARQDTLLWIDFERFLREPETGLTAAFAHVGVNASPTEVGAIVAGPLMKRYSKGPEHAYTPELRSQVLDQARREHGDEIRRGMDWLEAAGRAHPAIAATLAR